MKEHEDGHRRPAVVQEDVAGENDGDSDIQSVIFMKTMVMVITG